MPNNITVDAGQVIRGMVIDNVRPKEILVRFTKASILEFMRSEADWKKFQEWLHSVNNMLADKQEESS